MEEFMPQEGQSINIHFKHQAQVFEWISSDHYWCLSTEKPTDLAVFVYLIMSLEAELAAREFHSQCEYIPIKMTACNFNSKPISYTLTS